MTTFNPTTPADILATVQWALAEESPLEIIGQGSKRGIGRPLQTEHTLDLSKLSGVTLYEPAELVLSARAGTPLADIERLLAENGQQLAFEPIDYGPLLGGQPGRGTIGGVLAANLSGPRRLKAGAARDHILGINAVSGRGEAFKSGGRVVKNVTGYDLSKLMAGSWGTLAVTTDVIFKVLPAAETETTLAIRGLLDEEAAAAMALAVGSSAEISSAAHLPEGIAGRVADGAIGSEPATLLRIEGFGPSVAYRAAAVKDLLKAAGLIDEISGDASKALWRDIRDCAPFADGTERPVWRVSVAPSEAHKMTLALRMETPAEAFYDWQGGLVWLRMQADPEAELLRALVKKFGGGHATLIRATPSHCAALPVFEPQPPALSALSARLKAEFDPKGLLNPGRMEA
ncbi:glycolate oxidase subunit GlcE [Mesorhizobium sp. WSM2239]|uniref:Glycolate oxidase subunit GlcE n=2 Tax=unclassified Mesorhizobium TaxID=325217 RepID=A0AAU8D5I2_9HYPH